MGNDQSCCVEIDEKKGEIQSKVNSLKYSSIIHNIQNSQRKSNFRSTKNVFSNHVPEHQENLFNPQSSLSVHSSKISNQQKYKPLKQTEVQNNQRLMFSKASKSSFNQNHPSQAFFSSHHQKVQNEKFQNPEQVQSVHQNELNQEKIQYLRSSKASQQQHQLNNHYRSDIINEYEKKEESQISMAKLKAPMRTTKSSVEKQFMIEYLPIVRKVIERQRPFETELQRIPKEKRKTLRVNEYKDIYKGELSYVTFSSLHQYQKPHGYGVLAKENGNTLIGKFNNGSITGLAYYIFNNGSYYDGYMVDNKANDDQGQFHSKTMSYIGAFKDNLFHGQGKEISDHYYFEGLYQNHVKKSGKLMWNNKNSIQNPQKPLNAQQEELQIPTARRFQPSTQYDFIYEGSFDQNQQFTGNGKLKDPNGEYEGDFFEGKKQGHGVYLFDNKLKYIGQYKHNKKSGYGKLYNCDETMAYEGFWKDNLPDGKGYSYGTHNKPVELEFIQGISTLLAPESN